MVFRMGIGALDPEVSHSIFPFSLQGDSGGPETRSDPWSVGMSCRALCPGVMSPATQPPSPVSIPKSAATWSGSRKP